MARSLPEVEQDIESWIASGSQDFKSDYSDAGRIWAVKFFSPQYLGSFLQVPRLVISSTAGFTWGDGVYVTSPRHVYSVMLYGRIGVMGWVDAATVGRVFDAGKRPGLALYQEWIQFKPGLFRLLTTTMHSQFANRRLRNLFKQRFAIDLVSFRPDEANVAYVDTVNDRWFVITDFAGASTLPSGVGGFTTKVRDCELVVIGTEEFNVANAGLLRQELLGPHLRQPGAYSVSQRPPIATQLHKTYQLNRARGKNPPSYILPHP